MSIHRDLGQRSRGEIVEIELAGSAANVRLLDPSNFSAYRNGRQHRYTGGATLQEANPRVCTGPIIAQDPKITKQFPDTNN